MDLQEKFIIARWAYAIGEDYISDVEYDHLERLMKEKQLLPEYTSRGWSDDPCPYDLLKKYDLDEFIVPLTYSYSTESIDSIIEWDELENKFKDLKEKSRISYKIDGFSIRLDYYDGKLLRGSSRNRNKGKAIDLQNIIKLFKPTIPMKGKVLVTGELYLKNKRIDEYKTFRGIISQRNGVSTSIAKGDVEFLDYRCFNIYSSELENSNEDKYDILIKQGLPTAKVMYISNYKGLLKAIQIMGLQKDSYSAPTDGLVFENSKYQYAIRLGAWEEECNQSYVTGYNVNRGMYNNSVMVDIRHRFVNEKTVKEITVTNLQTILDNNLRVGYPIAFVERSSTNSVLDTTKTKELQQMFVGRYDEYREEVDSLED